MTVRRGEKMQTVSRKKITISNPSPVYTILETPLTLETSKPATPTFSYTVNSADFRTVEGAYASYTESGCPFFTVYTVSDGTISYEFNLNSLSVRTGSVGLYALNYATIHGMDSDLSGIENGDVIDVYLWSSTTDSTLILKSIIYNVYSIQFDDRYTSNKIRLSNIIIESNSPSIENNFPKFEGILNSYLYSTNYVSLASTSNSNSYIYESMVLPTNADVRKLQTCYGYSLSAVYGGYQSYLGIGYSSPSICQSISYYPYYRAERTIKYFEYEIEYIDAI